MSSSSAQLPLWYLRNTKQVSPHDILSATGSAGNHVALLFTTKELAEGQVRSSPLFRAEAIGDVSEWRDFRSCPTFVVSRES
jgi:hypothetical protein